MQGSMKDWIRWTALTLPLVFAGCSDPQSDADCERWASGEITLAPEQVACETDADCTFTSTSCCSCNNGGEPIAVNIENAPSVGPPQECCEETQACPTVFLCPEDPPVCQNGECQLPAAN